MSCSTGDCLFEGGEVTCSEYADYTNCHKERCTRSENKTSELDCCCTAEIEHQERVKAFGVVLRVKKHIKNLVRNANAAK